MNLSEAEVAVTTQKKIDNHTQTGDWFQLSDYGDMGEFYTACYSNFSDENNPIFRYPAWENIPDKLINKEWFSPNFFEIRDALERLEKSEVGCFMTWCEYHGHNIATDDAHVLVANFQDNHTSYPVFEHDMTEIPDDVLFYQSFTSNFFEAERYSGEVFSDNYD